MVKKKEEPKDSKKLQVVITIDDLRQQLTEKNNMKTILENQYYQVQGQILLLLQQIQALEKTEPQETKK